MVVATVGDAQLDDLRWRAAQHRHVVEVAVARDNHILMLRGVGPDFSVCSPLQAD